MLKSIWRWLCRGAALLGFLHLVITLTPVLSWWTATLSAPWGPDDGSTLIVPGSENLAPGVPGLTSYWRSYYAALVWRGGHFQKLVVSGRDVAAGMAEVLVCQGVPRAAIVIENAAKSTRENALFVARLLPGNPGRTVLLTSDYHSGRALAAFRKAGLRLTALPFPDAAKRAGFVLNRWDVFCVLTLETAKTAYYRARGWT